MYREVEVTVPPMFKEPVVVADPTKYELPPTKRMSSVVGLVVPITNLFVVVWLPATLRFPWTVDEP